MAHSPKRKTTGLSKEATSPAQPEKATDTSSKIPLETTVSSPALPRVAKPRYVRFKNRRSQVIHISVVGDDGKPQSLRVEPRSTTRPLREDRLTEYTRNLADRGFLIQV